MRHVDRAQEVDLQYRLPVGRLEFPEWKPELPGTGANRIDHVVARAQSARNFLGRELNRRIVADVDHQAERMRKLAGKIGDARGTVADRDTGVFGRKGPRDGRADSPGRTKDGHDTARETQLHRPDSELISRWCAGAR